MTTGKTAITHALELAKDGIPSFPCTSKKVPVCPHGFKDATSDPIALECLWKQSPGVLVGVPTGEISGFDVLDIDPCHGGNVWLDANRLRIPATRTHQTRSGGQHFYFRHHSGLRNSASKIASGVDVRADGGCAIWWPAAGIPVLNNAPIASWPDWLLTMAMPPARSITPPVIHSIEISDAYARAALRRAAEAVASAPEGKRNETLNKECWSVLRLVNVGALAVQDVANVLASAALAAGLPRNEIAKTLTSALRARGVA